MDLLCILNLLKPNLKPIRYPIMVCSIRFNGRGYKPLVRVRGNISHQSKIQMEDQKDEVTRKKGKMA